MYYNEYIYLKSEYKEMKFKHILNEQVQPKTKEELKKS